MLGSELEDTLKEEGADYCATDRELEITDVDNMIGFASGRAIKWIVNCAAYTAVDKAEEDIEAAYAVNSQGVYNLAIVANKIDAKVISFSTDYVFDGLKDGPYAEDDPVAPLSIYGKSKLEGEIRLRNNLVKHFIIRTSWLYGKNGSNFVKTMLKLMHEKESLNIVSDQWGCPTNAKDLVEVIMRIIALDLSAYGTYHYSNEGISNWYQFANEIYEIGRSCGLISSNVTLYPIRTEEYPTKAIRPKNSVLSKMKIKKILDIHIDDWDVSLKRFLEQLKRKAKNE